MRPDEARAVSDLAGAAFVGATRRVQELHRAIVVRSTTANPASAPFRAMHDPIASLTYATVRATGRASASVVGNVLARVTTPDSPPMGATAAGNAVQAILNASVGDDLADRGSALAITTAIRFGHRDVPVDPESLAAAFPDARAHVVVFVHGLGESEASWLRNADAHGRGEGAGYPSLLERDAGVSAVCLRYNTGRRLTESGLDVAELLEALAAHWPVGVEELSVVGHSMGGLVIRSATAHARDLDHTWPRHKRRAIYLGSPHQGSPVERLAARAERLLAFVPEGLPVTRVSASRSRGIKDLGHAHDLAPLDSAFTHFSASAGRDLLVPQASASAWDTPGQFADERHFPTLNHFDLLNHPDVYAAVRLWIAESRPPRYEAE